MNTEVEGIIKLYHICRECDRGDLTKGYIGVSKHPRRRWVEHRSRKSNAHVTNAFNMYDDIVYDVISEGSIEEILRMEEWLRPNNQIGWNIEKGGSLPPSHKGIKRSEETKQKLRDAHTGGRFTKEEVQSIFLSTKPQRAIAKDWNISQGMVGFIKRRERYAYYTEDLNYVNN